MTMLATDARAREQDDSARRQHPVAPPDPAVHAAASEADEAREQGRRLGSLAIGAPLTAAFLGMLLVDRTLFAGLDDDAAGAGGAPLHGDGPAAGEGARSSAEGPIAGSGSGVTAGAAGTSSAEIGPHSRLQSGDAAAGEAAAGLGQPGHGAAIGGEAASGESGGMAVSFDVTALGLEESGLAEEGPVWVEEDRPGPIGRYYEAGDDGEIIHGTDRDDILIGGAGDDIIFGYEGDDQLFGGDGDDILYGGPGDDQLYGGPGDDVLYGGTGDDLLYGGAGDDQLYGGPGDDILYGGAGDDHLDGGSGADILYGGWGDNTLVHNDIHDVAIHHGGGMGGENTYVVGPGLAEGLPNGQATFLFAENFNQPLPSDAHEYTRLVGNQSDGSAFAHIVLQGDANHHVVGDSGDNVIQGNAGDNVLYGGGGNDILHGYAGNNVLYGGNGDDVLHGGTGNDILYGGAGNDILHGGGGNNVLHGGTGNNVFYSGTGDDTYVFNRADQPQSGVTVIRDLQGSDRAVLEGWNDPMIGAQIVDGDLHLVVNFQPLFIIEGFEGAQGQLAGVQIGNGFRSIDDLLH